MYVALALIVLVDLAIIVLDVQRLDVLDRLDDQLDLAVAEELIANDDRQAVAALAYLAFYLLAVVTFIRWFSLAYRNLEALGAYGLRYGHGWSIGAWFVPILNLFRPKQIANDIWRASNPELPAQQGALWKDGPVPLFLLGWWLLWVVSNWVFQVYGRLALGADTVAQDRTATQVDLVGEVIEILAALAAAVVVRRTTRRQDDRATRTAPSVATVDPGVATPSAGT